MNSMTQLCLFFLQSLQYRLLELVPQRNVESETITSRKSPKHKSAPNLYLESHIEQIYAC